MSWHDVWGVLKWVLAALVAGFIGQFGKSLALFLIRRRRSKRAESGEVPTSGTPSPAPDAARTQADAQAKIEKKRAKAEVKRLKKSDQS